MYESDGDTIDPFCFQPIQLLRYDFGVRPTENSDRLPCSRIGDNGRVISRYRDFRGYYRL